MHIDRTLVVVLTILITTHSAIHGQEVVDQLVASLPADVREIGSAGRWRTSDGSGLYRVVVVRGGYETIADRLYIQWIREGVNGERQVEATVGVAEINDSAPVTLSLTIKPEGTNRLRIVVNTHNSASRLRSQIILVATTPTKYSGSRIASSKTP